MRDLMAKREISHPIPRAFLKALWHVDADPAYKVHRKPNCFTCEYIAVRTLTGTGELILSNGTHFTLDASHLGIFRASQVAYNGTVGSSWQFYWFEFDMPGYPYSLLNADTRIPMSAQEQAELERCFTALSTGAAADCMLAESLFNYLLADWHLRTAGRDRTGEIFALLDRGRRERLSIADLARDAGMSERSFRDAVHAATGLSPKAYMLKGEMTAAMELLRATNMPVCEIAACFHYSNPFYFSRVFKKYYGLSPQQVRDGISL